MNVYLRLLVKPHKKEKLLVSNNVLKLASKLLKVSDCVQVCLKFVGRMRVRELTCLDLVCFDRF